MNNNLKKLNQIKYGILRALAEGVEDIQTALAGTAQEGNYDALEDARKNGAQNIRKNQAQVDVEGNKIGTNRPDGQYNIDLPDGTSVHVNLEFDHIPNSALDHFSTITTKDPDSIVIAEIIR